MVRSAAREYNFYEYFDKRINRAEWNALQPHHLDLQAIIYEI